MKTGYLLESLFLNRLQSIEQTMFEIVRVTEDVFVTRDTARLRIGKKFLSKF